VFSKEGGTQFVAIASCMWYFQMLSLVRSKFLLLGMRLAMREFGKLSICRKFILRITFVSQLLTHYFHDGVVNWPHFEART